MLKSLCLLYLVRHNNRTALELLANRDVAIQDQDSRLNEWLDR
jgi:hypothetical protein